MSLRPDPSSRRAALRIFSQPAQRVNQLHLLNRPAARFEEPWRADEKGKALRARDRDVEAIAGEQKCEIARHVFAAGSRHRKENNRRLLALELVHSTDTHTIWQSRA